MDNPIRFVDIAAGETDELNHITRRLAELTGMLKDANLDIPTDQQIQQDIADGKLTLAQLDGDSPLQVEYEGLKIRLILAQQPPGEPLDRVFNAVAIDAGSGPAPGGRFVSQQGGLPYGFDTLEEDEIETAARYGILTRDGASLTTALAEPSNPLDQRFSTALANSRAEYRQNADLYKAILKQLVEAGKGAGTDGEDTTDDVNTHDWATIAKSLIADGTKFDSLYLPVKVQTLLGNLTAGGDSVAPSSIDIDLPSLDDDTSVEIVQDNLKAMQAIYFSSMLEELRLYQVADKLVELFNAGVLPFGKGKGGDLIFDYWRKSNERFTEVERLNLYARCFGFPGGEPMQSPNREFNDLWLRFVSAVSSFFRQVTVDSLLRAAIPAPVTQEGLRKAGRDLAANLSLYGYGVAYFAATSLQDQIRDIIEILQTDDVKSAYGARDMWQVVDQVASLELGGARNTVRYRTMAQTGATIIRWLGAHASELSAFGNVIDETEVRRNIKSPNPISDPTDRDLVDACEQWLAVTGTPDQQVEQYSQPVEAPNATSVPIQIPQAAKDLLDSVGVSAGVGGR
jgi:hypothetical protein